MHHYRHNIGDYRKDTGHLTLLEHGIYRQALDLYYLEERPLCADHARLMRSLCVRTKEEQQALENILQDFFELGDNGYEHARCEKELAEIYDKSEKAKASAERRWARQREKDKKKAPKNANASKNNANASKNDANASKNDANGMLPTTHYPLPTTQTNPNDSSGDESRSDYKPEKAKGGKFKCAPEHYQLAVWMSNPVKQRFPSQDIDLEQWADAVRKLITIDGYTQPQIEWLWRRVVEDDRPGFCWADNCRTPMKLRAKKDGLAYFEIIKNQMNRNGGAANGSANQPRQTTGQNQGRESASERVRRKTAEWADRQGVGQGIGG